MHLHQSTGLATLTSFSLLFIFLTFNKAFAQSEFTSGTIQIGLVVSNLEKSSDFYTKVIGMQKTGGFKINEQFGKDSGLTGGLPFEVTILKLQNAAQATEWKLMSIHKKTKHRKSKNIQDDLGMQYITINVVNLDPFLERLQANNIKLLGNTPTKLGDGRRFVLIQDPDGTFIELIGQ